MFSEKEENLYNELFELKGGDLHDRELAFEVMGLLGNESINITFDKRLELATNMTKEYKEKNSRGEI